MTKKPARTYGFKANLFVAALTLFFAITAIQALNGPEPKIAILWGTATLFNVIVLTHQYRTWKKAQRPVQEDNKDAHLAP